MFSNGNASKAILLVALVTIAYLPAILKGGMVWDDDAHVAAVEELGDSALRKIWTEPGSLNQYYPMTYSSFWLENRIWKLKPSGYHLTNVLLHGANSALLWSALSRLSVPYPFFIAAVFALHPVNVESVAWISERKNVLSGFFYLLSLLAYLRFLGLDSSGSRFTGPCGPGNGRFIFRRCFFSCARWAQRRSSAHCPRPSSSSSIGRMGAWPGGTCFRWSPFSRRGPCWGPSPPGWNADIS